MKGLGWSPWTLSCSNGFLKLSAVKNQLLAFIPQSFRDQREDGVCDTDNAPCGFSSTLFCPCSVTQVHSSHAWVIWQYQMSITLPKACSPFLFSPYREQEQSLAPDCGPHFQWHSWGPGTTRNDVSGEGTWSDLRPGNFMPAARWRKWRMSQEDDSGNGCLGPDKRWWGSELGSCKF